MKQLFLEDLSGMTEEGLEDHINYSFETTIPNDAKFIIAYESVGNWGCDSSAWFLFVSGGKMYEVYGSHCSCYGFEGQWKPDETSIVALKDRAETGHLFFTGGYDNNRDNNLEQAIEYVKELFQSYQNYMSKKEL